MRTIKFIGQITTVEPVNITMPNLKGMPRSQGKPMIPASSLRGYLRHSAHNGIVEAFSRDEQYLTVDEHYLLASGVDTKRALAVTGQSTQVGANQEIRKKHPFLSIWGYWGLAGKFSVGNAVATSDDALLKVNGGSRQHVFNRNETLNNFVDPSELPRLQDILEADKFSAEAIADYKIEKKELQKQTRETTDKDEKAEYRTRIEELDVLMREAKDARVGASESIQRPLDGYEAIDQGQMLPHRMVLKDPTDTELHLALWSIAMASLQPYVGGHSNSNFGEIHAKWDVSVTDINSFTPKKLGEVGFDDNGFFCTVEGFDVDEITKQIADGTINTRYFNE